MYYLIIKGYVDRVDVKSYSVVSSAAQTPRPNQSASLASVRFSEVIASIPNEVSISLDERDIQPISDRTFSADDEGDFCLSLGLIAGLITLIFCLLRCSSMSFGQERGGIPRCLIWTGFKI